MAVKQRQDRTPASNLDIVGMSAKAKHREGRALGTVEREAQHLRLTSQQRKMARLADAPAQVRDQAHIASKVPRAPGRA
jgi:hypothetical protein